MGCCQASLEIGEVTVKDSLNIRDNMIVQTEYGFGDLSLDSHDAGKYGQMFETSRVQIGDSIIYNTRSTSISLHRVDLEAAFLQSSGIVRKSTYDSNKIDHLIIS